MCTFHATLWAPDAHPLLTAPMAGLDLHASAATALHPPCSDSSTSREGTRAVPASTLGLIVELLCFCVQSHGYRWENGAMGLHTGQGVAWWASGSGNTGLAWGPAGLACKAAGTRLPPACKGPVLELRHGIDLEGRRRVFLPNLPQGPHSNLDLPVSTSGSATTRCGSGCWRRCCGCCGGASGGWRAPPSASSACAWPPRTSSSSSGCSGHEGVVVLAAGPPVDGAGAKEHAGARVSQTYTALVLTLGGR